LSRTWFILSRKVKHIAGNGKTNRRFFVMDAKYAAPDVPFVGFSEFRGNTQVTIPSWIPLPASPCEMLGGDLLNFIVRKIWACARCLLSLQGENVSRGVRFFNLSFSLLYIEQTARSAEAYSLSFTIYNL
jgi:hypothetical protein